MDNLGLVQPQNVAGVDALIPDFKVRAATPQPRTEWRQLPLVGA
jgi:hypothetical protein